MATNKPDSRETHITRIFGTNRAGEILSDIYVDVERMDIVKSSHQVPPHLQWQGLQRQLRWSDDPNADDYSEDGTSSRILEIVKVCDVNTQNPDDPDEWVPVQVIKGLKSRVETGMETNGGGAMDRFLAGVTQQELQTARKVEVRKISHYDTNIDDDAQAAADAGLKHYVVPSERYEKTDGSKDDAQFVDHEIILYLKGSGNHGEVSGQGGQTKLLNQYLIDENDDPDGEVTGGAGYNPPYRLDPFQNIINVQFKTSDQQWLLAIENATTTEDNIASQSHVLAANGTQWRGYAGASGSGITVIGGAAAYGAIELDNGTTENRFLACDTNLKTAKLGTVSGNAVLWQSVWSVPDVGDHPELVVISSISYANGQFFITFLDENSVANVVSTSDGSSFSAAQTPLPSRGSGTGPLSGGVAYLETDNVNKTGVYAMIGYEGQDDTETEDGFAFSAGFCWAISTNGISWSGNKIEGVFQQPGGGGGYVGNLRLTSQSFVAAGNGVFVAAASKRNRVTQEVGIFDSEGHLIGTRDAPYILSSAAVALSTNGTTWTLVPLPGAIFNQSEEEGDIAGTVTGVRFIKDRSSRNINSDVTGYFVACGYEGTGGGVENAKLWKSVDGRSWSLIGSATHEVSVGGDYWGLSVIDKNIKTVVFV